MDLSRRGCITRLICNLQVSRNLSDARVMTLFSTLSRALAVLVLLSTPLAAEIRGTQSTPAVVRVPVTLKAEVDLTNQTMVVFEHGVETYRWNISSGVSRRYPTPVGTFTPYRMHRMWHSRQWYGAPMPYAVFIHGGVAVHGTTYTGYLGRPASKGCIRLATSNAKIFYQLVEQHGKNASSVTIMGAPNYKIAAGGGSAPVRRKIAAAAPKPTVQEFFGFGFGYASTPAPKAQVKKQRTGARVAQSSGN